MSFSMAAFPSIQASAAHARSSSSPASSRTALQPSLAPPGARRRFAGVCLSSRQTQKKREKMYDDDDERPNVDYGPLNVRTGMSEENDQYEEKDSLALALELASQANDTKSVDIRVLNVQKLVFWTRYFVLATCFSKPQVNACIGRMEEAAQQKFGRVLKSTPEASSWVCLDFGDVVAHVFTPAERDNYDLVGLYAKATEVALPFEVVQSK